MNSICNIWDLKLYILLLLLISGQGPYVYIKINFINFNKFYYCCYLYFKFWYLYLN